LNILITISSLAYGGAEKQALEDANMLCENNKVFILTFASGPLKEQVSKSIQLTVFERSDYLIASRKMASFIRANQISIVHAHLYAPMVIAAIAGKICDIPVIWNFHSHAYENSFKARILHKYTARLSSVKRIIFPANELMNYYALEKYSFPKKKIIVGYNSGQKVDLKSFSDLTSENETITLGFIGRIIPLKRVHLLVNLAKFLLNRNYNNFKIDIVGDGTELETLVHSVKENNLESYISFHGFKEDTLSYHRRFDIFAFPSEEEVLSLSLIDAGMNGVASVAFNVGGNHEIINNNHTGFLVDSQEQFFEKIFELMQNSTLRNQFGGKAREECISKFSPSARLKFLTNLYEGLL
jgi:glycosyltransferase involved in cell wall biosynthesis